MSFDNSGEQGGNPEAGSIRGRHPAQDRTGQDRTGQGSSERDASQLVVDSSGNTGYVEAPTYYDGSAPTVFLAGGITGTPNWQQEARSLLEGIPGVVVNPRRENFPLHDPNAHRDQVGWEHDHLEAASVVAFWYPQGDPPACGISQHETSQPITFYELGKLIGSGKPLAVGADPNGLRRRDVVEQLRHDRPDLTVHDTLEDTMAEARQLIEEIAGAAQPNAGDERDQG